jgi:hypothetical protein
VWCQENNLSRQQNKGDDPGLQETAEGASRHIHIKWNSSGEGGKFFGVQITDKLKWSTSTDSVVKKVQQCLLICRRLKKCGSSPKTLTNFYRCTIECQDPDTNSGLRCEKQSLSKLSH